LISFGHAKITLDVLLMQKVSAFRRHRISQPMQIEVPIPKLNFFEWEKYIWTYGGMDKRTYIRTDKGEGETHFTCQDITCHMSVQCNAIQPSSIVQFSTAVGWFTEKYKKVT